MQMSKYANEQMSEIANERHGEWVNNIRCFGSHIRRFADLLIH